MIYQDQVQRLLETQKQDWDLLRNNHRQLESIRTRTFRINGSMFRLQFNPERIRSSGAKVDKQSVESRPCFLCKKNRPADQESVTLPNGYLVLCNPYPIFEDHLTIIREDHTPQRILNEFESLLDISSLLPGFAHFYNGPLCGASAPDHMHFQAGNRGLMPLEQEYKSPGYRFRSVLFGRGKSTISAMNDGLRRFLVIESEERDFVTDAFRHIFEIAGQPDDQDEPMMNILCYYRTKWTVLIFLRDKHRPDQYHAEGEKNILLSPASVDMGGTLIIPLEKDFIKITEQDIADIFRQVMIDTPRFNALFRELKSKY